MAHSSSAKSGGTLSVRAGVSPKLFPVSTYAEHELAARQASGLEGFDEQSEPPVSS